LKLKCDGPLSNFAFNFNLRRYNEARAVAVAVAVRATRGGKSPEVGRCRLTLSKPELKARLVSEYSLETKM